MPEEKKNKDKTELLFVDIRDLLKQLVGKDYKLEIPKEKFKKFEISIGSKEVQDAKIINDIIAVKIENPEDLKPEEKEVQKVEVINQKDIEIPEPPKEIKVLNLKEIKTDLEPLKKETIRQTNKLLDGFTKIFEIFVKILPKTLVRVIVENRMKAKAIAVKLVGRDGKDFWDFRDIRGFGGGGGGLNKADTTEAFNDSTIASAGTVGDNTKTVTVAGTKVQLPNVACKRVFIQAHESNTGRIVIGGSTVKAALVGRRGRAFYKTHGGWFKVTNLNLLYIDATVNGDKINYYYEA